MYNEFRISYVRKCSCGSDEESYWVYDAQGIELCKVCDSCKSDRLSGYRSCILNGYTQDDVDEDIEPS